MKTILLILLFYSLVFRAQVSSDTKHVYAGMLATVISSEICYQLTGKTKISIGAGFLTGVAIGAAKEVVYDKYMHRGSPTVSDFYLTGWGSLNGAMIMTVRFNIQKNNHSNNSQL